MISISSIIKNITYFLIIYISLEEFFLKWLPVSESIFESLHLISDFLIIVIIGLYFFIRNLKFKMSLSNFSLILFISFSLLSLLLSNSTLLGYFSKIWVLLRYVILFFILTKIKITNHDLKRFYYVLGFTLFIQFLIGLLLMLDLSSVNQFFEAREGAAKILVFEETIKGTFKFGVFYGFFIFISFVIFFPYVNKARNKLLLIALALLFTYLSGSRIVTIGIIGYLISILYQRSRLLTMLGSMTGLVVIFSRFSNAEIESIGSMLGLLSKDFWVASFSSGRLGIFNIVPMFFDAGVKEILIGFSYDVNAITAFLYQNYSNLSQILQNNAIVGIEDVYWIAFTYYYGFFGLIVFCFFYFSLMIKMHRLLYISNSVLHQKMIKSMLYLMFFSLICGFINQIFYIKTFSFYFWVFAALTMHPINLNRT